jgi:hypothetical protein
MFLYSYKVCIFMSSEKNNWPKKFKIEVLSWAIAKTLSKFLKIESTPKMKIFGLLLKFKENIKKSVHFHYCFTIFKISKKFFLRKI